MKIRMYAHNSKDSNWGLLEDVFGLSPSEWHRQCNRKECFNILGEEDIYCSNCGTKHEPDLLEPFPMTEEARRTFVYNLLEVIFECELDLKTGKVMITHCNGIELKEPVSGAN